MTLATTSSTFAEQFAAVVDLSAVWTLIPYVLCALALALMSRVNRGRRRWALLAVSLIAAGITGCVVLAGAWMSYVLTAALTALTAICWFKKSPR